MFVLEIYISNQVHFLNRTFTYISDFEVSRYCRVKVNFGHCKLIGFVDRVYEYHDDISKLEKDLGYKLNKIEEVIDEKPIIDNNLYSLAKWLSKVTISPFISCLNVMLPKIFKANRKQLMPTLETFVIKKYSDNLDFLTKKQKELYEKIPCELDYSSFLKETKSIGKKLLEYGLFEKVNREKKYFKNIKFEKDEFKILNESQKLVYESFLKTDKMISLLYGVTGSGKTEIYLHLSKFFLQKNKQVLILVPEIALTPQMIKRVSMRFEKVCFYHSNLNDQEKYYQYNLVKNNEVNIVVGTRSSIFLPFNDLGLIIVDEEHDYSYQQDNTPCYDAKEVAFKRAFDFGAKVLLASATPSLKSYAKALKNEYELLKLENRVNNTKLKVSIVDNFEEIKKSRGIIGSYLHKKIQEHLDAKNQIIILLNRRGYTPILKCADCENVLMCKNCDITLTYHQDENVLKCHHCGMIYNMINRCVKCGGKSIVSFGYGVKKLEEAFNTYFKGAKIGRFDYDSTRKKGSYEKIISDFEKHEYDILIGTSMIAKGLDFPGVSLVGIINGDQGLNKDTYRATEDSFDLIMQASGRAGRAEVSGEVIIQTNNQNHYLFKAIEKQDYDLFFNNEMHIRKLLKQPPYVHLISFELNDIKLDKLEKSLNILKKIVDQKEIKSLQPCIISKLNAQNRGRIIAIDESVKKIISEGQKIVDEYLKQKAVSNIIVKINPIKLL